MQKYLEKAHDAINECFNVDPLYDIATQLIENFWNPTATRVELTVLFDEVADTFSKEMDTSKKQYCFDMAERTRNHIGSYSLEDFLTDAFAVNSWAKPSPRKAAQEVIQHAETCDILRNALTEVLNNRRRERVARHIAEESRQDSIDKVKKVAIGIGTLGFVPALNWLCGDD